MPSLRRTISSPSVRSSPYPSALGTPTGRSSGPRRSSGSDTTSRRVLADIDWWLVTEGQHHADPTEERETGEGGPAPSPADTVEDVLRDLASPAAAGGEVIERPSTPVSSEASISPVFEESAQAHHYGQFAAFAAGPRTPTRRHASESSTSSADSSPSPPLTPRECPSFADMGFADPGSDIPSTRARPISLAAFKSYSFSAFMTPTKGRTGDDNIFRELADAAYIHDNDFFA